MCAIVISTFEFLSKHIDMSKLRRTYKYRKLNKELTRTLQKKRKRKDRPGEIVPNTKSCPMDLDEPDNPRIDEPALTTQPNSAQILCLKRWIQPTLTHNLVIKKVKRLTNPSPISPKQPRSSCPQPPRKRNNLLPPPNQQLISHFLPGNKTPIRAQINSSANPGWHSKFEFDCNKTLEKSSRSRNLVGN